jgi:hypothetical protein
MNTPEIVPFLARVVLFLMSRETGITAVSAPGQIREYIAWLYARRRVWVC